MPAGLIHTPPTPSLAPVPLPASASKTISALALVVSIFASTMMSRGAEMLMVVGELRSWVMMTSPSAVWPSSQMLPCPGVKPALISTLPTMLTVPPEPDWVLMASPTVSLSPAYSVTLPPSMGVPPV